ncbi:peptidylprolyl isomerase [Gorillibacterium sp. sgz5001074]|uniref:peptidylprolyl isomerase n=1 Tax=Gorillibacterium sp. sgz5001074 TaxID=3446695 RepID=UPI003F675C51
MEDNNKKEESLQDSRKAELEDEFGPEAFEDEPEEELDLAEQDMAAAAAPAKSSKLPWFLFAASVVAIGVLLVTGPQWNGGGMKGDAATVNGQKITKDELYQVMVKQAGEAALDNLITEKLINQEADKKKVQITDQDIEGELKDIKAQFPDDAAFNDALTQNKLTLDSLKEQIRTQVKVNKIFEGQMDLSDAKQKEYFDKNKDRYGQPEQIEVSHILVAKKEDADKLLADLKGGADFAKAAKEKSTDPGSKDNGGSLGFVAKNQGLDPAFEEAAFKLGKGEMSGVVQSSFGYHIIKVTDKKAAVVANYDEKKGQVKKDMVSEEVNTKAGEWLQKLKTDAKIVKL